MIPLVRGDSDCHHVALSISLLIPFTSSLFPSCPLLLSHTSPPHSQSSALIHLCYWELSFQNPSSILLYCCLLYNCPCSPTTVRPTVNILLCLSSLFRLSSLTRKVYVMALVFTSTACLLSIAMSGVCIPTSAYITDSLVPLLEQCTTTQLRSNTQTHVRAKPHATRTHYLRWVRAHA